MADLVFAEDEAVSGSLVGVGVLSGGAEVSGGLLGDESIGGGSGGVADGGGGAELVVGVGSLDGVGGGGSSSLVADEDGDIGSGAAGLGGVLGPVGSVDGSGGDVSGDDVMPVFEAEAMDVGRKLKFRAQLFMLTYYARAVRCACDKTVTRCEGIAAKEMLSVPAHHIPCFNSRLAQENDLRKWYKDWSHYVTVYAASDETYRCIRAQLERGDGKKVVKKVVELTEETREEFLAKASDATLLALDQEGRLHCQMFVQLKKVMSYMSLLKMMKMDPKCTHNAPLYRRNDAVSMAAYCIKERTREGPVVSIGEPVNPRFEGAIAPVLDAVKSGKRMSEIVFGADTAEACAKFMRYTEKAIELRDLDYAISQHGKVPEVFVHYGPTRTGKSEICQKKCLEHNEFRTASLKETAQSWSDALAPNVKAIHLEDWDFKKVDFRLFLNLLGGEMDQLPKKGGWVPTCPEYIYISTNVPIGAWFTWLSDELIEPMFRRIKEENYVVHVFDPEKAGGFSQKALKSWVCRARAEAASFVANSMDASMAYSLELDAKKEEARQKRAAAAADAVAAEFGGVASDVLE